MGDICFGYYNLSSQNKNVIMRKKVIKKHRKCLNSASQSGKDTFCPIYYFYKLHLQNKMFIFIKEDIMLTKTCYTFLGGHFRQTVVLRENITFGQLWG